MLNVLIVDDEVISRIGIVNLINWESIGYHIIDSVDNGIEALEIIRNKHIDLVITDIKMPMMSGIELIDNVIKEKYNCKFIVLSSYDDFQFVREALTLGALDYILKLDLDADGMKTLLLKTKEQLLVRHIETLDDQELDINTISSTKRDFLKQTLFGRLEIDDSHGLTLDSLGIKLSNNCFYVLMFKFRNIQQKLNENSIRQLIDEVLIDYEYAYLCDTGFDELSIIYNVMDSENVNSEDIIEQLAIRIQFIMKQFFNQNITVFISKKVNNISKLPKAYSQVCETYSKKSFVSKSKIVFYKDVMDERNSGDYKSLDNFIKNIEMSIFSNEYDNLISVCKDLEIYINTTQYIDLSQIQYVMSSIIYFSKKYIIDNSISDFKLWDNEEEQYNQFEKIKSNKDFTSFLNKLLDKLKIIMVKPEQNHIVRNVKKYLNNNYRSNLIIKDISQDYGVTSIYLSSLFKKVTGETIKDYIIGLKIEKAKELLKDTNDQIHDISTFVGYDNDHYFSRIFKLKVGMTPTQYRNK